MCREQVRKYIGIGGENCQLDVDVQELEKLVDQRLAGEEVSDGQLHGIYVEMYHKLKREQEVTCG
jgi:hypothetical protein